MIQNLRIGMVIENRQMVLEKSWKDILQSLWEPCKYIVHVYKKPIYIYSI